MNEIKQCPFCRGKSELKNKIECSGQGDYENNYFVKCNICGGTGHKASTPENAIKNWNIRSGEYIPEKFTYVDIRTNEITYIYR